MRSENASMSVFHRFKKKKISIAFHCLLHPERYLCKSQVKKTVMDFQLAQKATSNEC